MEFGVSTERFSITSANILFEMAVLRRICGVTRRDRRRNVDIMNKLAIDRDIVELLQIRRLTYFGHVSRMQPERCPHILLHGHIAGSRPQGRPRKKWIDNIKEDCSFLGITPIDATRSAQDRSPWRILGLPARGDPAWGPSLHRQGIKSTKSM